MLTIRKGLALALAAGVLVAGCGGKKEESKQNGTADTGKKEPVKISFWHAMDPASAHGKVLKQIIDDFNKSQTEVIVEDSATPQYPVLEQKITSAITTKDFPVLIQATDSILTNLVKTKALKELDSLIPAAEKADYGAHLFDPLTFEGKTYGVPFNKSMIVLIYDKTLVPNPPKTWDEFKQVAAQTTVKGQRYGTALETNVFTFGTFFGQTGGAWINNGKATFNSAEGVQAMDYIADLFKSGSALQIKKGEFASNFFNEGRAAMIPTTSASFAFIKPTNGHAWGVAPLMAGPKNDTVPFSGANLAITRPATDAQTKAAMKFVLYLTGKEGTLKWGMGKTGYMPVRKSAYTDPRWTDFAKQNPEYEVLGQSVNKGTFQPTHPQWAAVQNEITSAVEKVVLGQATSKEALDAVVQKADPLLNK